MRDDEIDDFQRAMLELMMNRAKTENPQDFDFEILYEYEAEAENDENDDQLLSRPVRDR